MENLIPKVSVVIATHNCVDFVDALCLSLFCQTEKDIQIIFVDDASNDGTIKLLKRYEQFDKRIEVYQQQCNNLLEASLWGLQKVRAPYTLLLNGTKNIVLIQNCLHYMLENMLKTESELLYTSCCMFNQSFDKLPLYQVAAQDFAASVKSEVFSADDINADLLFNLHLYPWGKMYKTDFLKKLKPEKYETAFFLKCLFATTRISAVLDNLYMQKVRPEDLWQPETFAEMENCEQILIKCNKFEKYKNGFINYELRRIVAAFNEAPKELKSRMFEQMKTALFAIDYNQYDPAVVQKSGITSVLLELIGLNYEQYAAIHAEHANGRKST